MCGLRPLRSSVMMDPIRRTSFRSVRPHCKTAVVMPDSSGTAVGHVYFTYVSDFFFHCTCSKLLATKTAISGTIKNSLPLR